MESLDLVDEKVESVNGPEFDVLGGIFKRFKLQEWELQMFSKFLEDPFNCNIVGNMKRYGSDILDDWVNYNQKNLNWITHLDTFKFWWSYTKDTSFETFVCAVNFEQYEIADLCTRIPSNSYFRWPKVANIQIKDPKKYMSYVNVDWRYSACISDYLTQFPLNVTKYLLQNNTKIYNGITIQTIIDKNLIDLLPYLELQDMSIKFNRDMLKKADMLIKHGIMINYKIEDTISLSDSEIEILLSISPKLKFENADAIYRVESIRRKMLAEGKLNNLKEPITK